MYRYQHISTRAYSSHSSAHLHISKIYSPCVICIDVSWKRDIGATDVGSYEPCWASWCRLMFPIRFCMRKTPGVVKYWWKIGNKSPRLWRNTRRFFALFFGAFSKLRRATISFVVSVRRTFCLSVCLSGTTRSPTWRIFMKFYVWGLDENLSGIFKFREKICKHDFNCTRRHVHVPLWYYLAEFFLEWDTLHTKFYRMRQITHKVL
jgi:hypothetical protein